MIHFLLWFLNLSFSELYIYGACFLWFFIFLLCFYLILFQRNREKNRLNCMSKDVGRICEMGEYRRKYDKWEHYQNVLSFYHMDSPYSQQQVPIPIDLSCQAPKLIHFPLSIFWACLCDQQKKNETIIILNYYQFSLHLVNLPVYRINSDTDEVGGLLTLKLWLRN